MWGDNVMWSDDKAVENPACVVMIDYVFMENKRDLCKLGGREIEIEWEMCEGWEIEGRKHKAM